MMLELCKKAGTWRNRRKEQAGLSRTAHALTSVFRAAADVLESHWLIVVLTHLFSFFFFLFIYFSSLYLCWSLSLFRFNSFSGLKKSFLDIRVIMVELVWRWRWLTPPPPHQFYHLDRYIVIIISSSRVFVAFAFTLSYFLHLRISIIYLNKNM